MKTHLTNWKAAKEKKDAIQREFESNRKKLMEETKEKEEESTPDWTTNEDAPLFDFSKHITTNTIQVN